GSLDSSTSPHLGEPFVVHPPARPAYNLLERPRGQAGAANEVSGKPRSLRRERPQLLASAPCSVLRDQERRDPGVVGVRFSREHLAPAVATSDNPDRPASPEGTRLWSHRPTQL